MRYIRLGKHGPQVSVIGLGLWQLGQKVWGRLGSAPREIIRVTIEHGITLYDTAEIYGNGLSEKLLGEALRSERIRREEVVIATKLAGFNASNKERALRSLRASLERLGTNYVDLYQIHWPPPKWCKLCDVLRGLEEAVERGLIRYIGLSNFPVEDVEEARACLRKYDIVSVQFQYSLAYRAPEKDLIPYLKKEGIGALAWSPLAKGALTGEAKERNFARLTDPVYRKASRDTELLMTLKEIANNHDSTPAQIALAWLIAKGVVPIPGARKVSHVISNAKAAEIVLSDAEVRMLDETSAKYLGTYGGFSPLGRNVPCVVQRLMLRIIGV